MTDEFTKERIAELREVSDSGIVTTELFEAMLDAIDRLQSERAEAHATIAERDTRIASLTAELGTAQTRLVEYAEWNAVWGKKQAALTAELSAAAEREKRWMEALQDYVDTPDTGPACQEHDTLEPHCVGCEEQEAYKLRCRMAMVRAMTFPHSGETS